MVLWLMSDKCYITYEPSLFFPGDLCLQMSKREEKKCKNNCQFPIASWLYVYLASWLGNKERKVARTFEGSGDFLGLFEFF